MPDYHLIAAEFALGRVLATSPLSGGGPDVVKLTTTSGDWVIKPGSNRTTAELYPRVASALNAAGLRQAVPRLTVAGFPVSVSGYPAQEFLPGRICLQPTAAQIAATMRHIAEYHRVLEQLRPPAELSVADNIFQRVASAEFLLRALPGLVRDPGTWPEQPTDCQQTVEVALGLVHDSLPLLNQLPTQLVHGDIGPDNVLMNGDDVVSIIDFTPYDEPFLFALSSAVYWYHSYGRDDLDQSRSVTALPPRAITDPGPSSRQRRGRPCSFAKHCAGWRRRWRSPAKPELPPTLSPSLPDTEPSVPSSGRGPGPRSCTATSHGFQSFETDKLGQQMTATRAKSTFTGRTTTREGCGAYLSWPRRTVTAMMGS